jgi:hypothetical protein
MGRDISSAYRGGDGAFRRAAGCGSFASLLNQADLNRADFCSGSGRFAVHAGQFAPFQQEALAAPGDGVAGEAPGP